MTAAGRAAWGLVLVLCGCPSGPSPRDGGSEDGGSNADAGATDAGVQCSAQVPCATGSSCHHGTCGPAVLGEMHLFELTGTLSGQPMPVTLLDATASFHPAVVHDYDGRQAGLGCFADHHDAVSRPVPLDGDAGSLRMSGFLGGTLLSGAAAANPIVCVRLPSYYTCIFPVGVAASQAPFSAADSPLGPGPITFGTSVGADFGALSLQRSPDGSLSTTEDLSTLTYAATKDLVLHVTCSPACTGSRISVEVTALQSSTETGGWPYPSVGLIRCVLPAAPTVTIPSQAVAAMLATDTRFDTIVTRVARLATTATTERDVDGNPIVVETGRGVFGRAPH